MSSSDNTVGVCILKGQRVVIARCFIGLALVAALISASSAQSAQTTRSDTDRAAIQPVSEDFLWAPDVAPEGPVMIIISLETQRGYVYRNGVLIGASKISTGKAGHETPTGIYTILQKDPDHHSNKYSNAPMPFMQRLTWDGVALHAGHVTGRPASHGCIRLPYEFAKSLFAITRLGLTVVVSKDALAPEAVPSPAMLDAPVRDGHLNPEEYYWTPERSPRGPMSIVVSSRDQRILIVRNGVAIGSSAIRIDGPVTQTEAFSLRAVDDAGFHWLRLSLPGHDATAPPELTPQERARAHLPEGFRSQLAAALLPGTTLLVTRDTIRTDNRQQRFSVLAADDH